MNIGMLWFDKNPNTSLAEKIQAAADYYKAKYGRAPNLCFVHPSLKDGISTVGEIEVRTLATIRPNNLWLGVDDVLVEILK